MSVRLYSIEGSSTFLFNGSHTFSTNLDRISVKNNYFIKNVSFYHYNIGYYAILKI